MAVVLGTSVLLSSCGGDDDGSDAIVLDGLWKITEIEVLPVEEEPAEEEEPAGDDTNTEGDATDEDNEAGTNEEDNTEPVDDFGYLRFGLNTYEYFQVSDEKVTIIQSGTYQLSGKTLSLTNEGSTDIVVAMIELNNIQLTMNMTINEEAQIWHAQKMTEDPYLDDEGDKEELIDFENEVHSADSVPGSLLNPDPLILNETFSGTLDTLISQETYKAEQFFYLKVDTAKTYELTVRLIEPEYDLPAKFLEYVQVWLSYQPFQNHYKAEDNRIEPEENEALISNLKSPTGYLYVRLFSYQNEIDFQLTLTEQVVQD